MEFIKITENSLIAYCIKLFEIYYEIPTGKYWCHRHNSTSTEWLQTANRYANFLSKQRTSKLTLQFVYLSITTDYFWKFILDY